MKEIIESNKPEQYFFELQQKKASGKKLTQLQRVFIELYANKECPCYHFVKQISPAIINYHGRIDELRTLGFIIPPPKITYVKKEKHTTYTLDKNHIMVEKKESWWEKIFKP